MNSATIWRRPRSAKSRGCSQQTVEHAAAERDFFGPLFTADQTRVSPFPSIHYDLFGLADVIPPTYEGLPDGTTDPGMGRQWHHEGAGIQAAWNYLKLSGLNPGGRRDVVVAVIDTGIDAAHEDLVGNIWTNPAEIPGNGIDDDRNGFVDDVHGCSVVSDARSHSGDSADYHGHGTHVAGIVAATAYNHRGGAGVAFNTQVMAVRAAQYSGMLTTTDIAEGILYAIDNGAEVLNMSFGGYQRSQIVADALEMALSQAVLIAAAGNDGVPRSRYPMYPAALPSVHGVMASKPDGKRAWFSNSGYSLMAPGESIYSTLPGNQYAAWSGTSMAAPVVSGIAALMRSWFWQREIYSSRFLMGGLEASSHGAAVNAYRALIEMPTPGVTMLDNWVFDKKYIDPRNDEDGIVDSGETIHLAIEVMNRSGFASNVTATLRARAQSAVFDDPFVTMLVPTVSYGNIGPFNRSDNGFIYDAQGVLVGVQRPFVFSLPSDCPNDHVIPFELTVTFRDAWDPGNTNIFTRISRFNYTVVRGRDLPRVISSDMELTAQDYWLVRGPVLIEPGATVRVRPGTQIQWGGVSDDPYNPGPQNGSILVRGSLLVEGTNDQPVSFFPSYLVSGQTVRITVEGGLADLRYAKVRNPELVGFREIDHAYFDWDAYSSTVRASNTIANTIFHKLRGGGMVEAWKFDTVLFDAGWIAPSFKNYPVEVPGGSLRTLPILYNTTFLQDNENDRPLSLEIPSSTFDGMFDFSLAALSSDWVPGPTRGLHATNYSGTTYYLLFQVAPFWSRPPDPLLQGAELVAQGLGGHVASVTDDLKQQFLFNWLQNCGLGPFPFAASIYVGLSDEGHYGVYEWLDGSPSSYGKWEAGFPVAHNPLERQVVEFAYYWDGLVRTTGWRNQPERRYYPTHNAFILQIPGSWTVEQLDAAVSGQQAKRFLRQRYVGDLRSNAFLSKYWDPSVNHWMRFYSQPKIGFTIYPPNGGLPQNVRVDTYGAMNGNYWGTGASNLIDHAIVDYYDNFTTARVDYWPPATNGFVTTYPFAERVLINGLNMESVPTLGSGRVDFTVTFNRDMNANIEPFVTFGPSPPYTDFQITPRDANFIQGTNGWMNARTWQGSAWLTPVTGNGYHCMRVSGAVCADDSWLVTGYDVGRFRFRIQTAGVAAMALQANGAEGAIELTWQQDDFALLAGYNLYRATNFDGPYERMNSTIIPVGQERWSDTNVVPAVPMFYKFTVVTTDFTESDPSNIASAAALDTIPPVLSHTPMPSAPPSRGLRVSATANDNLRVASVTLYYRTSGSGSAYTVLPMVNSSSNYWSATISGSAVQAPGVQYYVVASDGISEVFSGTPLLPHLVQVSDVPTLSSVTPNHGPAAGGTTVTLSGALFDPGASVLFGGVLASNVVVLSANQLTCVTPPHFPAMVDVTVVNTNGTRSILLNAFRFEETGILVSLPNTSGDYGSQVELALSAANVMGLRAAEVTVTFNTSVLSAQSVRLGTLTTGWALSANLNIPGRITLSLANASTVTGSGSLALLRFNVIGAPPTSTPLTLTNLSLNDGAMTATRSDGLFTVNGFFRLSGAARYFGSGGAVPRTFLSLVGAGAFTAASDTNGLFSITNVPTGSYILTPSKTNDVAEITAYDASLVLQAASGLLSLSPNQILAADVNRNGSVSAMDASYILEKSVGLIEGPFPGAGRLWDFVPSQRSYALLNADQTGQDFTAILLGDVSGNWTPPAQGGGKTSAGTATTDWSADALIRANTEARDGLADEGIRAPTPPLVARAGGTSQTRNSELGMRNSDQSMSKSAETNSPVVVGLKKLVTSRPPATNLWLLAKAPAPGIYSVDLTLDYDPAVTRLKGIQTGPLGEALALAANTNHPGVLRAALAGAMPVQGVGGLLILGVADTSDRSLRITGVSINEGTVPVEIDGTATAFDQDTDGDGQTDWEEMRAGTDANDARASFCVATFAETGDGSRTLRWATVPGRTYRVQYKNSLSDADWINVGGEVIATGGSASQVDGTARQAGQRFYRIVLVE